MRESLMYGSVRGTRGNSRPYRDVQPCTSFVAVHESGYGTTRKRSAAQVNSAYRGAADSMRSP